MQQEEEKQISFTQWATLTTADKMSGMRRSLTSSFLFVPKRKNA